MTDKNYKSAYEILQHPFSNLRRHVADKFFSKKLTLEDFINISKDLLRESENFDNISTADLSIEIKKAYQFLKNGTTDETPNIKDSPKQLVWGMALACSETDHSIRHNWPQELQREPIYKLQIWNDIKNSATARFELRRHAFMVSKMSFLREEEISMKWGSCKYPNVGFYFNQEKNQINLDMLWGLIAGFEHSRAMQLHEIGHGFGTLSFGKKMQDLQQKFDELNQKARTKQIKKDEYRRLLEIEREYKYRFSIFDEAENSYANRFAANSSVFGFVRQDISYDLNSVETQLFNIGNDLEKNKDGFVPPEDTPGNRAYNLQRAIRLSFFVNNGIVEDNPEEWKKLGINIDWIECKTPDGQKISGMEAFKKLRNMTTSLEDLQIKERDYYKSDEEIAKLATEYAEKRCDIIDEIFDQYALQYYEEAIHGKDKETPEEENQNDKQQNNTPNNNVNNNSDNNTSNDESPNDEENSENVENQNTEKPNNDNQDNNSSDKSDGKGEGENLGNEQVPSEDSTEQSDGKGEGENLGNEQVSGEETIEQSEDNEQAINNGNDQTSTEVSNTSPEDAEQEEQNYDNLTEEEKENLIPDKNGNIKKDEFLALFDTIDEDQDILPLKDFPNTPEEAYQEKIALITEEMDEEEKEGFLNIMDIINSTMETNEANTFLSATQSQTSEPFSMPKTLMPENEFSKIVSKHFDMIEELKVKFTNMQNEYYGETDDVEVKSLIPETGNLKMDLPSYIERLKKKIQGKELKEKDFENFIVNDIGNNKAKAPIDIAILIDNSGSMQWAHTDRLAIEMACSIFQATRDNPAFNVYVALMHNPTTWIAKPGDNSIEISSRLATIYHGNTCGDDKIGDNIVAVLNEIKDRNPVNKNEGSVNFFMITDGDHTDSSRSFKMVNKITSKDAPITFNWLLTQDITDSDTEDIIKKHQTGIGSQRIDYEDNITDENMLSKMISLIERRVADIKQIEAMRTSEKQNNISIVLDSIAHKNGGKND